MATSALRLIYCLCEKKYIVLRISTGVFAIYFFAAYLYSFDYFFLFRSKTETNCINSLLSLWPEEHSKQIFKALLGLFIFSSFLFSVGVKTRLNSLIIWAGYTLCYNFYLCINQPHVSYFLFILITYLLLSRESFGGNKGQKEFLAGRLFWPLTVIYMLQMTISGFSKALSVEWQSGSALSILSQIYDPEPGIYLVGTWHKGILQIATWLVLFLECISILYLIFPKLRFPIWISHVLLFAGICLMIPHAHHVAFVMLMFNLLILDKTILPSLPSPRQSRTIES